MNLVLHHHILPCQVEYLSNSIDFNRKDRAKRYHKSSIFNHQYSIPACPGWVLLIRPRDDHPQLFFGFFDNRTHGSQNIVGQWIRFVGF
jgi:hypothetical protein